MTKQIAVKLPDDLVDELDRLVEGRTIVSRDAANDVMRRVLVAPVTRRVRGVPSEIALGAAEGLPAASVASFDNLRPFPKAMLVRRLGSLGPRQHEMCRAAGATLDC